MRMYTQHTRICTHDCQSTTSQKSSYMYITIVFIALTVTRTSSLCHIHIHIHTHTQLQLRFTSSLLCRRGGGL